MVKISDENIKKFDRLCLDIMEKNKAVGVAASFFTRDNEVIYENFYGYRNAEKRLPVDENTIFGLASITKSFVTLCILKLEQEGKISLSDPVSAYFPSFTGKNMKKPLQLKHLLCHAGGFYPLHRTVVYDVAKAMGLDEDTEGDFALSVNLAQEGAKIVALQMDEQTDLIGSAGERMSYCNDGFGLLSDVVRMAGGENTFSDYLRKNILEPLKMDRTCCDFLKPAMDDNSSMLYTIKENKLCCHHDYHDNSFVLNGAGVLKSTLSDMKKYVSMYLNEGKNSDGSRIVLYRYLEKMMKPRQVVNPDMFYCYGITLKRLENFNLFGHSGGLPGVSSYFSFMPEAGIGGVVLCNTENASMGALCEAGMMMCIGKEPAVIRHDISDFKWTDEFINDICGKYEASEEDGFEILKADGDIILRANGSDTKLHPVSPCHAIAQKPFSDVYLKALTDDEGKVYAARYSSRVLKKVK